MEIYDYSAFISYKSDDEKWAKWLQQKLADYSIPTLVCEKHHNRAKKLKPCFRYHTDISPQVLKDEIYDKLKRSKCLIVVCSRKSTQSQWVGEEVRIFCEELGRYNKVIPFIVDGEPYSGDENECFHQVIRELFPKSSDLKVNREILGVNIHEEGTGSGWLKRARAVTQVVSALTDISFTELWDLVGKRARRKRAMQYSVMGLALLALLLVVDFYRTKRYYYADYVVERGMPKGLYELSRADREFLPGHYVFEWSEGKLKRVVCSDAHGHPISPASTLSYDRAAIMEIIYANGKFAGIMKYNEMEQEICKETYSYMSDEYAYIDLLNTETGNSASMFNSQTNLRENNYNTKFNLTTFWSTGKAKIGRYVNIYDEYGYVKRQLYKKHNGELAYPGVDASGVSGIEFVRDSLHRAVEIHYLDKDENYTENRRGIASRRYRYNEKGMTVSEEFFNIDGDLVLSEECYAKAEMVYDYENGTMTEYYYDDKGEPCLNASFYHMSVIRHIENGMVIKFCGLDGKPIPIWNNIEGDGGYAYKVLKYDNNGYVSDYIYLNTDSIPTFTSRGVMHVKFKIKDGLLLWSRNFDAEGNKINGKAGFHEQRMEYDGNNLVSVAYYHYDGHRINVSPYNMSKMTFTYDKGRLSEKRFYDANDMPVMSPEAMNTCGFKLEYGIEHNNPVKISFLGSAYGSLMPNANNFAVATMEYNEDGNCKKMTTMDVDEQPCISLLGYATVVREFTNEGYLHKEFFYDTLMKPIANYMGVAVVEYQYDDQGNVSETCCYDTNALVAKNVYGWARLKNEYENGRPIARAYFGVKGEPIILDTMNAHLYRAKYNDRGILVEGSYYDCDSNRVISKFGYWRNVQVKDERGLLLEETFYDTNDKLITNDYGVAKGVIEYNDLGWVTKIATYDENGDLVINRAPGAGYAYRIDEYNDQGVQVSSHFFGEDSEPIKSYMGMHKVVNKVNSNGASEVISLHDENGDLCSGMIPGVNMEGAVMINIYNDNNDNIYSAVYDESLDEIMSAYPVLKNGKVEQLVMRSMSLEQLLVRYANGSADRLYFSDDFLSIYDDAKVERVKQLNKTLDSLNEIVDAKFGEYIKELQ